ncbi:MAG: protein O-mannosyl-transferase family [Flavobacteriales bacterium]
MSYNKINIATGWVVWAIATVVYMLTLEPTMPFWDCGEFIASANRLEVGHPPGAPLFMLISRLFTAGATGDGIPYMMNLISGLSSSFTILFLFWTITHMAKKLADIDGGLFTKGKLIAVIGAGAIGSLVYSFSDTFWFSAVEAEVYAMSSLFTAVVFWAILKWEAVVDEGGELRWVILIAYLMGLSIGVHLLNLLAIPAICYVYYFKKHQFSWWGVILTGVVSLVLLLMINSGIIIWFVQLAGSYELAFTNAMGAPFNVGGITYALLIAGFFVLAIWSSYKEKNNRLDYIVIGLMLFILLFPKIVLFFSSGAKFSIGAVLLWLIILGVVVGVVRFIQMRSRVIWNTLLVGSVVAILGYTSFATIIIRSQANPPMDENNPENLFSLLSYLNREQYGDRPLLYGQYFNTPQDMKEPYRDGADVWVKSYSVRETKKNKLILSSRAQYEAQQYIIKHPEQQLQLVEEYIESGEKKGSLPNYDERYCGIFPRMHSGQANHIADYKLWSNYRDWNKGEKEQKKISDTEQNIAQLEGALNYYARTGRMPQGLDMDLNTALRSLNRLQEKMVPSVSEDFRYFTSYQCGWMYFRYFMWNFAGRQNDKQGHGNFNEGQWISGVKAIDEERVGNRDSLTDMEKENKGLNTYYFLPLVLGLIGLVFQLLRHPKDFSVVGMLFFLTGMAIVIYLNQSPQQPRERDYAYAGSFYAFAIWIGLGIYALYHAALNMSMKTFGILAGMTLGGSIVVALVEAIASDSSAFGYSLIFMSIVVCVLFAIAAVLNQSMRGDTPAKALIAVALALPVPALLLAENYDDHDRSGRETGIAMATNYLESLQPNAIIFTNGDNDTFPLWYAQEVEGIRTDVRVVNLSLLNTDWYIDQMKRKAYLSEPVPFKMAEQYYRQGTRDVMYLDSDEKDRGYVPVQQALDTLLDNTKFVDTGRNKINYLGTHKFSMEVPAEVAEQYRNQLHEGDSLVSKIEWAMVDSRGKARPYITKAQMMVLDLLANMDWNRPVYFAVTTGGDAYMGLERYFQLEGLAYRLTPILHKKSDNPNLDGGIGTNLMQENMMTKFQWGNMDTGDIYLDENNRRMTTNLRLQFNHLAEQLITEGRMEEAKAVLNKSLAVMPERNVPYEQPQIMWQVADLLYQAGDSAQALALSKRLHQLNEQQVAFFESLEDVRKADDPDRYLANVQRQSEIERDVITALQISDRLQMMASEFAPDDPEVETMRNYVYEKMPEFGLEPYDEQMKKREEQMMRMRMQQDSARKTLPVTLDEKGLSPKGK